MKKLKLLLMILLFGLSLSACDNGSNVEDPNIEQNEEIKYKVSFDSMGGTVVSSQKVVENESATKPNDPQMTGYKFLGWYLNDELYDFSSKVTSDISLKAKWEKIVITYTITYRYEDDTLIKTEVVEENSRHTQPSNPTKEGYDFIGWYLKDSISAYNFGNKVTSNLTLYAKFKEIEIPEDNGKVKLNFTDSYYDDLNGDLDTNFKYKLHELIESTHTNRLSYSGVWDALLKADADPNKSGSVLCFYTGVSYSTKDNGSVQSGVWNREHVWPKSLGFDNKSHPAHNDCHHLHATEKAINAKRGNSFFGEVTSGSSDAYGNKWTSTLFEPRDEVKGDVARSILYMVVRYENNNCNCDLDLELVTSNSPSSSKAKEMGNLLTLLKWHYEDPVSDVEMARNNIIYSIQGNKNPFIDHPEFVQYLYTQYVSEYTDISKLEYLL